MIAVDHGDGEVEDTFFEPGAPVLEDSGVGVAFAPCGWAAGGRGGAVGDGGGRESDGGPELPCVETELPDEGGDLVAAELEPCGVAGSGCGGAVIEAEESGDGDWVVAPWVGADGGVGVGVADVVEVETVYIVAPEEVHGDVERVLLDGGVAWVEGVVGAVPLDPVVALGEPVVGVAAFSDLDEEGVAVGGAGVGDELGDLGGGFEASVEGVDPEAAEFLAAGGGWQEPCEEAEQQTAHG